MFDWLKKRFADPLNPASALTAAAHKTRGDAHADRGRFAEAVSCYRDAIASNPGFAEAHANLSNAYRELQRYDEAEHCLRHAIRLKPDFANFYYNLASLLMMSKRQDEAIDNLGNALRLNPEHDAARAIMLYLMQQNCRWQALGEHIQTLRRSAISPATMTESVFSPFIFIGLPGTTLEEQLCCARKWACAEFEPLAAMRNSLGFHHSSLPKKKITVAYLSGDLHDHPVAKLMVDVFERHDREQFRVLAYSYGPGDTSPLRKRLQCAFDEFVDIRAGSDADCARRIYADETDVLVDLTGYTQNSRSGILALRPAPVQIAYLGYPGTMGADFVDYLVTDRVVTPPEMQAHFSEKLLYMPHCFFPANRNQESAATPPSRIACGLPEQAFVFCCFNKPYKFTPQVFAVWMRMLNTVAGSILWLSDCSTSAKTNLRHEAALHSVDERRIVFAPRVDTMAEHLARHHHADLFLDTLPYNAHTTCSDALWMGVPVITCIGSTFTSRVAGSLLTAIGLPELIADDLDDYYKLAINLATNATKLDLIKRKLIAHRDTTPLFDSSAFTRDLENLYLRVVAQARVGSKQ